MASIPSHVKGSLLSFSKYKFIDLVVKVLDSRAPITTNSLQVDQIFTKSKILTIHSKSDLSFTQLPNSFDFRDPKSRKKILNLIQRSLRDKKEECDKRGYLNPHLEILIVGFPNVGKSSLINLLFAKKMARKENYPGLTRKISKFHLGDNLWLYDSPGVFCGKDLDDNKLQILYLINSFPSHELPNNLCEVAFKYLSIHFPKLLSQLINNPINTYENFLLSLTQRFNLLTKEGPDFIRAESKFLGLVKNGQIGKIDWDNINIEKPDVN